MQTPSLAHLPPSALTARLYEIRKEERTLLLELLVYVAEVDRRSLYLDLGFSSLFAFLTDYLGYTRSAAFRRSTSARLLARFPEVAEYLADGRLCLTTLVELREILDPTQVRMVLDRAAGKTEEQVKELVAAIRPRPEPMDLLRRLPRPTGAVEPAPIPTPVPAPPFSAGPAPILAPAPASPFSAGPAPILAPAPASPFSAGPAPIPAPAPRPTLTPISEERRVLRMTVGREFVADLDAVKAALSHQIPDGNLETVIHECLRRTLCTLTRRRHGTGRPARTQTPRGRYVPAPIRAEVFRRDQGRCTFVGSDGHRCDSTYQIQVHHIAPYAKGGPATVENLTLMCGRHNRHIANAA